MSINNSEQEKKRNRKALYKKIALIKERYPQFSVRAFYWDNLMNILKAEEICFLERKIEKEYAALYYYGIKAYIAVNSSIRNIHEIEYALCHEIAHHWLHCDIIKSDLKIRSAISVEKKHEVEAELVAFIMYNPTATAGMNFWELLIEKEAGKGFYEEALDILTTMKKSVIELRSVESKELIAPINRDALNINISIVTKKANLAGHIVQFREYLNELAGAERAKQ